MRKRKERGITFGGDLFDVRCGKFQFHPVEPGEDLGNFLARVLPGSDDTELHIRMSRKKTDQFFARVTGRADNSHSYFRHIDFSKISVDRIII